MNKKLRCAIYTRKSSDEGLDQNFNSLDAQREACAAYCLSQAGEGWTALADVYDDGGYSGGSMERPAVKRLMADVEAKRIDIIVVYKVDRLTRSLADFARIVEILDRTGVSFVSITQAFNTTTSMGRLTLNVLLSFAQFEREVTGERIRDKIAASKAKGMWMGGHPPLGYDVRDRSLQVNGAEAAIVRDIYARYLRTPSVFTLRDELARDGIRSKRWTSRTGRDVGGLAITYGALYYILSNRLYRGDTVHRGKAYPGQHAAIIDGEVFDEVQAKLKAGAPAMPAEKSLGRPRALLGKLFDDCGNAMTSAHANKDSRRYFYYASTGKRCGKPIGSLARASSFELEQLVQHVVASALTASWHPERAVGARALLAAQRVVVSKSRITIDVAKDAVDASQAPPSINVTEHETHWRIESDHQLARLRHHRAMIGGTPTEPKIDRVLLRNVLDARRWAALLSSGEVKSIAALAAREKLCPIYTGQVLPLAYLAPELVGQIVDGRQPKRLSLSALIATTLPLRWADQRALFARFA